MTVEFELECQEFLALNGGPQFKFTPAMSFYIWCKDENEINHYWRKLSAGGSALFELKKYPWAEKYGWCIDQFGLSWQMMIGEGPQKIAPAFLFTGPLFGKAETAMNFYMSNFENSKVLNIFRDPKTNSVMHAVFSLNGQAFVMMEGQGGPSHPITLAVSLMVQCKNQEEIDTYWENLSKGGSKSQCGWLEDQFGVSWQTIPTSLAEIMTDSSPKGEKAMAAMLKMKKIDIEKIMQAYSS